MRQTKLARAWRDLRWRFIHRRNRLAMGWRYAWETMTENDANSVAYDCALIAGVYPLESLDRENVLEQCRERFGDHPEMADMVTGACERVFSKWNSTGDSASAAEDWAMDLVQGYASDGGITLNDEWSISEEEPEPAEAED